MNRVAAILSPARCLCQVPAGGKKRVFELVADVLAPEQEEFHPTELVAGLLARERLGSTALGGGIAIPHCRLRDWQAPAGVLLSFSESLDFDAPDGRDIDLMCALVVPQEASDEHLEILATLARLFSDADLCATLRAARTSEALYNTAINWAERAAG